MPLLRKGIILPAKGVDFSVPASYVTDQNTFSKNMRFYRGELGKRPGKTTFGDAISGGQIMGFGVMELASIKYLVRASKTKLEKYNTTTKVWDSISGSDFTGGDENFFSFANIPESELLIISNGGYNLLRKWTGAGNAAALGGDPPKAKYMTYLTPYLLLAHIDDGASINPWKVQWCDAGNPELWAGGTSGSDMLSRDPSPIMNIMRLNEFAAVYKQDALCLGQLVSNSDIFQFSPIKSGIGLAASRALAEAEGMHYFMAANDFYRWNGIREESIGGPIRDEVFSRLDREKIMRCFALHVQELTEIWFYIVVSGASWPTEVWKFNYRTGFWYYDTCLELTAAIKWQKIASETWDDDAGTWDEALDVWDAGDSTKNWEEIVFGDKDGVTSRLDYTKADDGSVAVEAVFETKDFIADEIGQKIRWEQLDIVARGSYEAKFYVDYSIDEGDTWVNIPYTSSQAYCKLAEKIALYNFWFDVYASEKGIRFRARNAESGELFFIRGLQPYYLSKEQKKTAR